MYASLPPPFSPELKVLVLAGSNPISARRKRIRAQRRARGELEVPLEGKAFLELRGRMVIEYVLDWLQSAGLRHVWVLADEDNLRKIPAAHEFTPIPQRVGATLFVNLSAAHAEMKPAPDEPVLVVFGDHPLNTTAALEAFLSRCAAQLDEADFFHGFTLRRAYEEFLPWFSRTCVNLREMSGRATGMNLAIPSRLHRLRVFDELYAIRKQERLGSFFELLRRVVGWLGWRSFSALVDCCVLWLAKEAEKAARGDGFGARFGRRAEDVLRRFVPAARMEGYAARILQAERGIRLVPLENGGTAIDVDFAEELQVLERDWDAMKRVTARQDRNARS